MKNNDSLSQNNKKIPAWQLHKRLYNWVLHWSDTPYGLLALIILSITEPIFVPIPADVMVVGLGLSKPRNGIKYGLICSICSVLGGTIAFCLGNMVGGDNVIRFFDSIGPLGNKAQRALELYREYDFWAVSISALTPVPYMLFSWLGGLANISLTKFIAVSIVFRTLRFGTEGVLFYFLGEKARRIIEKHFNTATVLVMIFLALAVFLMKKIGH